MMTVDGHVATIRLLGVENAQEYLNSHKDDKLAMKAYLKLFPLQDITDEIDGQLNIFPQKVWVECNCRMIESVLRILPGKIADEIKELLTKARKGVTPEEIEQNVKFSDKIDLRLTGNSHRGRCITRAVNHLFYDIGDDNRKKGMFVQMDTRSAMSNNLVFRDKQFELNKKIIAEVISEYLEE